MTVREAGEWESVLKADRRTDEREAAEPTERS